MSRTPRFNQNSELKSLKKKTECEVRNPIKLSYKKKHKSK